MKLLGQLGKYVEHPAHDVQKGLFSNYDLGIYEYEMLEKVTGSCRPVREDVAHETAVKIKRNNERRLI